METVCSFCGAAPEGPGALLEGGGDPDLGLPTVRICRPCAEACAAAFQTENGLERARQSSPPRLWEPETEVLSGLQEKQER